MCLIQLELSKLGYTLIGIIELIRKTLTESNRLGFFCFGSFGAAVAQQTVNLLVLSSNLRGSARMFFDILDKLEV